MSAASFDDSSNLVDIPQPESNGNTDAAGVATDAKQPNLLDEPLDDIKEHTTSKHKSKKSKAKKLLKRAKSPISGAINKTTKEFKKLSNLPKHHHSAPKSPSKSPSRENLTDEYGHLEDKLGGEKKSEEWLAFQQMQDRIKQTVLKTQNSLNKYHSTSEDDEKSGGKPSWTDFDEGTGLEPEELIDTTLATNPAINVSCVNASCDQQNLLDSCPDTALLVSDSSPPPICPVPLVTSGIISMENLGHEAPTEPALEPAVAEEVDLLGLGSASSPAPVSAPQSSNVLTDDLLGMDGFMGGVPMSSENVITPVSMQSDIDVLSGDMSQQSDAKVLNTDLGQQSEVQGASRGLKIQTEFPDLGEEIIQTDMQVMSAEVSQPIDPQGISGEDIQQTDMQEVVNVAEPQTDIQNVSVVASQLPDMQVMGGGASQPTDVQTLSGYTFTSSTSGDLVNNTTIPDQKSAKADDDFFFEQMDNKDSVVDSGSQNAPANVLGESLEAFTAAPPQPTETDSSQKPDNTLMAMLGEPLNPLTPAPVTVSKPEPEPVTIEVSNTSVLDDFASFDPMKADSAPAPTFQASSSPIAIVSDNQSSVPGANMFGTSPQSYGSMPAAGGGSIDLLSKIKMMSSGSQPVSPARRPAPKPKDHFGFVKKELKKPKDEVVAATNGQDEDDDDYKTLADLGKPKVDTTIADEFAPTSDIVTSENDTANATNNPFLSGDFDATDMAPSQGMAENVAAVFGLDEGETKPAEADFDFDKAWETDIGDTKRPQWTNMDALDASEKMFEESEFDKPATNTELLGDSAWDTSVSDSKPVDVWGSDAPETAENSNPFQLDDFSKLDDVPIDEVASANANPFLSTDASATAASDATVINPFLDFGGEQPASSEQSDDLLGVVGRPVVLSDSENFFMDSVSEPQKDAAVADDIFDPFKVTSKPGDASAADDPLDLFSNAPAPTEVKRPKPKSSDGDGFKLEIKSAAEVSKNDAASPAPLLKPPPKPPKSPQPPRENPFDRDSPPEENFAQFEIKDIDKPKEPPPKSLSTESTETEEEEVLEPLSPFLPPQEKEGFKLMLRYPTKKKIAGNRYWKHVFVKLGKQSDGPAIKVYNDAKDSSPLQELLLQPCYSLSDVALQQYDQYGKIHTVKLQYVFYKERVGIKTERITPSIVKFKKREKPKATMILDHSPQVSELLKFGSLDKVEIEEFIREVEDTFMHLEAHREKTLTYAKDEVTAEVHDEYMAELNKFGKVLMQKARVRVFVLAFLTGNPTVEIGLNDKRRRGKEVVGRCDIIPIKTEEWIRLEDVEFHCSVKKDEFEKTNDIKFHPLDACQFELLRYRIHLRENKELPLQLTVQQIFKHRKCEIRCDLLVTGYHSYSKKHGQFACEDIEVRFPIPETWIYMFRYERRFGYGSIHSATRKPGKIKGLERLTMMAQGHFNQTLMEADVGTAKYEHVYRSVVWRIPRLPVRNQGAYTSHLMKLRLELGPHDEVPDTFSDHAHVEFTMPCSTVSQSQIRSIAVTNPNPPEKWVRSMAHYKYNIEIEHLDEYPEMMAIGTVYKEATMTSPTKSEEGEGEENQEPPPRDPRLAVSDTDSSDSD